MTARIIPFILGALVFGASPALEAQQAERPALEVRMFTLRHLSAKDAMAAVEPYLVSEGGRFFGPVGSAITVRETPRVLARIDSVLDALDQPPPIRPTVRLRFQLVGAQNEAERDARIASLDSTLRDLFRFQGYRLLAQTVVTVGEWNDFSQSFVADGDRLLLSGRVNEVRTDADSGRITLHVELSRPHLSATSGGQGTEIGERVFSTGLGIPLGQTVVLGSGVSGESIQALILVVTPELAGAPRD